MEHLQVVGPEAPLVAVAGQDLVLPCFITPSTSAVDMTVEWLRLNKVVSLVHLYKDHKDRHGDQDQSYRRRTSLFKDELQKGNTSLKLSALRVSDEGAYKCLIENKSWYDDITVHIIVEGKVFAAWKWIVGISVLACLLAVGLIITAAICYKKASELQKEKRYTASELQKEKSYKGISKNSRCIAVINDWPHAKAVLDSDGEQEDKDGRTDFENSLLQGTSPQKTHVVLDDDDVKALKVISGVV
ncbi:butyrophilin-like protein 3 [Silurus meridionalis]|nr:butyrophilin-like protein 3 [Silurus meridionalis]